jgi:hypothetical protein
MTGLTIAAVPLGISCKIPGFRPSWLLRSIVSAAPRQAVHGSQLELILPLTGTATVASYYSTSQHDKVGTLWQVRTLEFFHGP